MDLGIVEIIVLMDGLVQIAHIYSQSAFLSTGIKYQQPITNDVNIIISIFS